jgi:hypothetical protein
MSWTWVYTPTVFNNVTTKFKTEIAKMMHNFDHSATQTVTVNDRRILSASDTYEDIRQARYRIDELPYNRHVKGTWLSDDFQARHLKNLLEAKEKGLSLVYELDEERKIVRYSDGDLNW